jgi:chemotaxis protein MotB
MSKKKQHHEEHIDETWLIPYADMLTLLLALFIVMFAMSKVDTEKMSRISEQFNIIFAGGSGFIQNDGSVVPPIELPDVLKKSVIEENQMEQLKSTLEEAIENAGYTDKITVALDGGGLDIAIQDIVLFHSGDAQVVEEAMPMLLKISEMLGKLDGDIKIVGHTDNVPIRNSKFRSNWDLSAIRAINVKDFMVEKGGLQPQLFSIQAYGEYKPKYDNTTVEGRAKNRRVEIHIDRKYPGEQSKNKNE